MSASFLNYFPKEKPIQSMRAQLSSVMKLQLCTFNLTLSIFQLIKKQQKETNKKQKTKLQKVKTTSSNIFHSTMSHTCKRIKRKAKV